MLSLLLGAVAGLCDRVRGGWPEGRPKWVAYLARYIAVACMVGVVTFDWRALLTGVALAGTFAWQHDNGWRGDWVRGDGSVLRALRWGALWGATLVPAAYFAPLLACYVAVMPVAALIAIWVGCKLPPVSVLDLRHGWPWSELLELPIASAIMALVLALAS